MDTIPKLAIELHTAALAWMILDRRGKSMSLARFRRSFYSLMRRHLPEFFFGGTNYADGEMSKTAQEFFDDLIAKTTWALNAVVCDFRFLAIMPPSWTADSSLIGGPVFGVQFF